MQLRYEESLQKGATKLRYEETLRNTVTTMRQTFCSEQGVWRFIVTVYGSEVS